MPIYEIQLPDGKSYEVDAPNEQALQSTISQLSKPKYDGSEYGTAADGMSGLEKFGAGMGKAFVDIGRAIGQPLGLVSQEDIEASRGRDAPLMDTGAGMAGNIVGTTAALAPTMLIPGANTLAGAAAIGAGSGLALTPGTLGERATSAALGGLGGFGGTLAGRAMVGAAQGGKALIEPLTQGGREKIVGRTLNRFAADSAAATQSARQAQSLVPGSYPTLAEATADPGLAQLQRAMQSTPDVNNALATREMANRAARRTALEGIAKTDDALEAAMAFRQGVTKPLYDKAMSSGINVNSQNLGQLADVLNSTHAQDAWERALRIAGKNKIDIGDSVEITPKHLQFLKIGFDDLLDAAPTSGIGKNERQVILSSRNALNKFLTDAVPEYKQADKVFAKLSKPIDRMKVGQYLYDKLQPALNDFGSNRENANQFALALRNSTKSARSATDFGRRELEDILTRREMATVNNIAKDLARSTNKEIGRALGSNTSQNLSSQNLLRRTLGPLGMPESWLEESLLPSMMVPAKAAQFLYNAMPEAKIQGLLGDALLDPQVAARLMSGNLGDEMGLLSRGLVRALPAVSMGTAYGLLQ